MLSFLNKSFTNLFGQIGTDPVKVIFYDKEMGRKIFKSIIDGGIWHGEIQMYNAKREVIDVDYEDVDNK